MNRLMMQAAEQGIWLGMALVYQYCAAHAGEAR